MRLTQERLRELLDYDPLTGVFLWKVNRGNRPAGSVAGGVRVGGGKRTGLGTFSDPEEAHRAYQKAAVKEYGEYARFA